VYVGVLGILLMSHFMYPKGATEEICQCLDDEIDALTTRLLITSKATPTKFGDQQMEMIS
jgi:hypothetical protein